MTVLTKAQLQAEIASLFPDNTSGQITPARLRQVVIDIVDSYLDAAGASTAAANLVYAGPTTGAAATPSFRSLVNADLSGITQMTLSLDPPLYITNGGPGYYYHETDLAGYEVGTAQGGSANTVTLRAGASALNDFTRYKNAIITITAGPGAGQAAQIGSYNGATKVATITGNVYLNGVNTGSGNFSPQPTSASSYSIGRQDYGYVRLINDDNMWFHEIWNSTTPAASGQTPFAEQREYIRINRWIDQMAIGSVMTGKGDADWWLSANYVWDAESAQTPKNFSLYALSAATNTQVEALRLVPNNATPYFWTATNIKFGVGANGTPDSLFEVRNNANASPGTLTADTVAHVVGANAANVRITVDAFGSTSTSVLTLRQAGGTAASPSKTTSAAVIGSIGAFGYFATTNAYTTTARASIDFVAGEDWNDSTHQGAFIALSTTPNASGTKAEAARIWGSKGVSINNTTDPGAGNLSVTGAVSATASVTAHSGTAIPAGGTAGAGVLVSSTANFGIFFGSGAPTLSAAKGSLYLRSDGSGTNDRAYINTNGSTTWTAIVTVA